MTRDDRADGAVREAIRELRAADERDAPPFGAVLARPRSHQPVGWRAGRLALAAGLVFAAGAGVVYRAVRPERLTVPSEVIALSAWRPMTDVLLETSNSALLREMPRLGASLITPNYNGELR